MSGEPEGAEDYRRVADAIACIDSDVVHGLGRPGAARRQAVPAREATRAG